MLYNYLKVTLRNIWRSKINSLINILGLSVGIACAILIILFVKDELTFDQFHTKIDRLYRVTTSISREGDGNIEGMTPFVFGLTVKDEVPDIEGAIVHTSYSDMVINGDLKSRETISIMGADFFDMFDFEVLHGSIADALNPISNVVITKSIAEKYFGRTDVVGKTLQINAAGVLKDYQVSLVLDDVPSNSSLQFDLIINDENLKFLFQERQLNHWFMIAGEVYVLLRDGVQQKDVEAKFPAMVKKGLGEERYNGINYKNGLQPMADIHLGPQMNSLAPISDSKYTIILSAIAGLILLIACINFITISLAKSVMRSREIGVRKSIGAQRGQLVSQFMIESYVIAFFALIIGLFMVWLVLPLFNELSDKQLVFQLNLLDIIIYISLTALIAFLAGFYPSIVVSAFKPTKILKGDVKVGSGRQSLRIFMVGAQFIVTIFLITSTLIMREQLQYMQNKHLGFDRDQLLMIPLNVDGSSGMAQQLVDGMEKGERFITVLNQQPTISAASMTSHSFGPGSWTELRYNDENDEAKVFFFNTVHANYIRTMGMKIIAGRDFEIDNQADQRRSILVNQAFVKAYNLESPIGKRIPNEEFDDHEIIGLVEDFNFASLHMPIEPLVIALNPMIGFSGAHGISLNSDPTPKVVVNVLAEKAQLALASIESSWQEVYPGEPFDYSFVDEQLDNQYAAEQNLGKLVTAASVLAIIIGCMGLFALAMLTMNARLKEMSIRKVLGANNINVVYNLSKGYITLIMIALLISIPLSYYIMSGWLSDFAYRISIGPSVYIAAAVISIIVAWLAISYHSIKMATNNPVHGLRSE